MSFIKSSVKQKILLLLLGGISFGYSYTPKKQWKIIKEVSRAWRDIDKKRLRNEINNLYRSKLVERKENPDNSCTIILTSKGKLKALTYYFDEMRVKSKKWDGRWRMIAFDIPENLKKGREALREKLKKMGFYEFQKSVLVYPYKCEDEMNFIIEFFGLRKYVRFGVLESVDNELHLKKIFNLD